MFNLIIEKKVEKEISKLEKRIRKRVLNKLETLKKFPIPKDKNHILDINKNFFLCELDIDKYRIYYIVEYNKVIINKIKYRGNVIIQYLKSHKSGSFKKWNKQRDFINWIKKKFKRI